MTHKLSLPDTHSLAESSNDGRMYAPSAARNKDAICTLVSAHAPLSGRALEIASGTGEHACALAACLSNLQWQPSDPAPDRRRSIDLHAKAMKLGNISPAIDLDAAVSGWSKSHAGHDLIVLVNLLHLIPTQSVQTVISEAAQALNQDGVFILYGPFLRDGETTSEGDAEFDANLRRQNPDIGYKDDWDVIEWVQQAGLELVRVMEMPANNLAFVSRRP
ncbi:hypothetical protein TG4357_00815 [Thalassovita gelatinovora]|uniref:Methyltransferase domain protein n=1 Tax=Thalassovita gelatinovora TaxID=53501 RepID=A0A0P1F727_THAGE|nr:DUF938 domain-containing protein [Thalassovita gelatinovora]QIZ79187.1 DUF938 domain-containing protein [Thalassovita gelatinovora]CUH63667.1 hypothetical protein TG4357_00815 [Thalassovita gelatinovora]SER01207.1 Protein of unknown function [Thalassovita gelatinovora]